MTITSKPCPGCRLTATLEVNPIDWISWRNGMLIQQAFPYLTKDQRERLITGYCSPCWDSLFGGDDEENQ